MIKPAKPRQDLFQRADALVRNPTVATAAELLRLVHQINPTGRMLRERDSATRYRLKAALQSVLVERFYDDLVIEPSEDSGVVGLRHRYLNVDGCHAIVEELSEEARSRIRRRLDSESGRPPTQGR
jgi:hypothetical protein